MSLYTGCIYSPRDETVGTRISIMSRHTDDTGLLPDPLITQFDEWYKELAPRNVGAYKRGEITWETFTKQYLGYLQSRELDLRTLGRRALHEDITLLCKEATPEFCHRKVLAEEIARMYPDLRIFIR